MALIKCPECGKEVSSEAASCPYCGYPIKNDVDEQEADIEPTPTCYAGNSAQRKQKRNLGCFGAGLRVAAFIVGFILLVGVCASSSSGSSTKRDYNTESAAKVYAKEFVKDNLKAPSTAKFCNTYTELTAKNLGGSKWKVTGWVDSQNSFGATVRSDFVVTLTLSEKGATCNDIDIKTRR